MMALRGLAAVLSTLFLLAISVLVALLMLNPAGLKGQFEAWASEQLGRQLAIDGDFQLQLGRVVQLAANRVRLANVAWGSQPEMLVAQRVLVQLDLRSLFGDTIIVPRIEVDGLDVLLERNAEGLNNWQFDLKQDEEAGWPETPPVVVELVNLPGARLRFIGPRLTRPLELQFDTLEQQPAPDEMLVLRASGQANEVPLHLGASFGPLANLLKGENLSFALEGALGEVTLKGQGRIDDLGTPADTELALNISGPDADYVTRTLGVRNLGSGPVKLDASIAPAADRRGITGKLSGVFGELTIEGSGDLVDPADLKKLGVQLQISGPDLSLIGGLLDINQLPAESFTLEVRFERNDESLVIETVALRLKDAELQLQGSVSGVERLTGNDLSFTARGSDLARVRSFLRIPGFATGPFDLAGRLKQSTGGKELLNFTANTQLGKFTATGPLGEYPGFYGSRLQFTAAGADFARLGTALKIAGLPVGAFDARGQFEWTEPGVTFKSSTLKVAGDQLTLDGLIGTQPPGKRVDLRIAMQGKDPRLLARFLNQPKLPTRPYTLSGRLRRDRSAWRIDDARAELAGAKLRINGVLGNPPALHGTKLSFSAEGPDLAPFSGVAGRKLPKVPFKAAGSLASAPDAIRLEQLSVSAGDLKASGGVTVGLPVSTSRTDFDVSTSGRGLDVLVPELSWLPLARQPGAAAARGSWRKDRLSFAVLTVETDTESVSAQGDISLAPVISARGMQLTAAAKNLAAVEQLFGLRLPASFRLPAAPLQFRARVSGNVDALVLDAVSGTVGETDFSGRVQLDLTGKPNVDIQLRSDVLNLSAFSADAPATAAAKPPVTGSFIPDMSLPLDLLNQFNGQLSVRAGKMRFAGTDYTGLKVDARLKDGHLTADPFQVANPNGAVSGRLDVQQGAGLAQVRVVASGTGLVLALGNPAGDRANHLKYDGQVDLTGRGRTLRELASSLQGKVRLTSGPGRLPNSDLNKVYSSFFRELWSSLNPLVKRQPYTEVICAAYLLRADAGILHTDPALVLRVKGIDIIAHGSVNLRTEAIDFNFKTVARSGLGISVGQMLNPYVKITGTMAKPRLTLDPKGTLVTGGAAVATLGLSVLATTVWDRLSREQDPCATAIAEADKRVAASPP
jgi:hypothetical protein